MGGIASDRSVFDYAIALLDPDFPPEGARGSQAAASTSVETEEAMQPLAAFYGELSPAQTQVEVGWPLPTASHDKPNLPAALCLSIHLLRYALLFMSLQKSSRSLVSFISLICLTILIMSRLTLGQDKSCLKHALSLQHELIGGVRHKEL